MSTSKHLDKICIAGIVIALIVTILFMNASSFGITGSSSIGYEDRLFNTDSVHTIDIVMNDWDEFIENCESEQYSSCTAVIDGEKYSNIAIRAKGNTSLSSVKSMNSQRYSFKLEFDQYEDGKSYYGLDKLCLNNLIQDNTMMKDYLVYQMMYNFGVDAPLCSYVYITVNGEDWGLYLAVEGIEDSFLQRNYGSESGDLYKPDTLNFGAGRGNGRDFNMDDVDFEKDKDADTDFGGGPGGDFQMPENMDFSGAPGGDFQMPENMDFSGVPGGMFGGMGSDDVKLKYSDDDPDSYSNIFGSAKTDVKKSDQKRLIAALKNLTEYTDLENTLDMDEVLRYFVVHNFVVNGDSYTGSMIHNYYLYEEDGLLHMIPWDYNLAYGTFMGGNASSAINDSIDNPVSGDINDRPMVGWIFSDEKYTDMYHNIYAQFIEEYFDNGKLADMISSTTELIRPYVEKDPTKFCTIDDFNTGVDVLTQFVALRAEAVNNQLKGDNTPVDSAGLNLSSMGSMGGGAGGFGGGPGGDRPDGNSKPDGRNYNNQTKTLILSD